MNYFKSLVLLLVLFSTPSFAGVGFVTQVKGTVRVNGKPIRGDVSIDLGAKIETERGQATLLLGEETVLYIAENSKLTVTQAMVEGSNTQQAKLESGRIRALIRNDGSKRKKFLIETTTGVMGVRGTQVFVAAPDSAEPNGRFLTLEGLADLRGINKAQKPIQIDAGQFASPTRSETALQTAPIGKKDRETVQAATPQHPPELLSTSDVQAADRIERRSSAGSLDLDPTIDQSIRSRENPLKPHLPAASSGTLKWVITSKSV